MGEGQEDAAGLEAAWAPQQDPGLKTSKTERGEIEREEEGRGGGGGRERREWKGKIWRGRGGGKRWREKKGEERKEKRENERREEGKGGGRGGREQTRGVEGRGKRRGEEESREAKEFKPPCTKADCGCGLSELLGAQQDGSAGGGPGVEGLSFTRWQKELTLRVGPLPCPLTWPAWTLSFDSAHSHV